MKSLQDNLYKYQQEKDGIISGSKDRDFIATKPVYVDNWQHASYTFTGDEIYAEHKFAWWYGVFWKEGRIGQHMKGDAVTMAAVRQDIIRKLGRPSDEISHNLIINARGETPTHHIWAHRDFWPSDKVMFNTYTVGYYHRRPTSHKEYVDETKKAAALAACEHSIFSTLNAIKAEEQAAKEAAERAVRQSQIDYFNSLSAQEESRAAQTAAQVNAVKAKHQSDLYRAPQLEAAIARQSERISEENKMLQAEYAQLHSCTNTERARLVIELWNRPHAASVISTLQSFGLDTNLLAAVAIDRDNNELFDFALKCGANYANCKVNKITLLQRLIHDKNEPFVKKILEKGLELTTTLVNAIVQNDNLTLETLLTHDISLLIQRFAGYTLLQIAIAAEHPHAEVVQKLLSLNGESINIFNSRGESALKIAVRSGNEAIIKLVASHAILGVEIEQLGNVDAALKDKILEKNDIDTVIKLFKGEQISLHEYLSDGTVIEESKEQDVVAEQGVAPQVSASAHKDVSLADTKIQIVSADEEQASRLVDMGVFSKFLNACGSFSEYGQNINSSHPEEVRETACIGLVTSHYDDAQP